MCDHRLPVMCVCHTVCSMVCHTALHPLPPTFSSFCIVFSSLCLLVSLHLSSPLSLLPCQSFFCIFAASSGFLAIRNMVQGGNACWLEHYASCFFLLHTPCFPFSLIRRHPLPCSFCHMYSHPRSVTLQELEKKHPSECNNGRYHSCIMLLYAHYAIHCVSAHALGCYESFRLHIQVDKRFLYMLHEFYVLCIYDPTCHACKRSVLETTVCLLYSFLRSHTFRFL